MTLPEVTTRLVAILNLTPDSFSDGNQYVAERDVAARVAELIEEGADVIDVGAESTRPDAIPVTPEEEWSRLAPHLSGIVAVCRGAHIPVSLDTRHVEIAEKGLHAGVDWINDVGGLRCDRMTRLVRDAGCTAVYMHAVSVPPEPSKVLPQEVDPISWLLDYAQREADRLEKLGIRREKLIFDPGIGFGKTAVQNFQIISFAERFRALDTRLLFGHSRKRFMQLLNPPGNTFGDETTLTLSAHLMIQSIDYLRVHAVGKHATIRSVLTRKESIHFTRFIKP